MICLARDVWTLSDELSACCFMGVSGFGFGRLVIALVFGISTAIGAPSSLLFVKTFAIGGVGTYLEIGLMWTRSLE